MFQITKCTPSDRIYPIECTYIRIEDILSWLWPRQILRAVKDRAIWWGKELCTLTRFITQYLFFFLSMYLLQFSFPLLSWLYYKPHVIRYICRKIFWHILSTSLFLYFNYLVSTTAGEPECSRWHMKPSSMVIFGWFVAFWEPQNFPR